MYHGDNAGASLNFPQNVKIQADVNPVHEYSYYGQKRPADFQEFATSFKAPPSLANETNHQFIPRMTNGVRSFHSIPATPTFQYSLPVIREGISSFSHHELNSMRDGNTLDDPELHHADADAATEQLSQALQSSHEFDKMAFQAVTSAIEDLQKKGILTISENNTNEAASFHLNANASKFFMTDHQTHTYAHQDFDVQPSSSEGVEDELRAEVMPSSTNNQAEMSTAYSGVYNEASGVSAEAPIVIFADSHKDNKVLAMLKFLVKYTDMEVSPAWIAKFLKQNMPEEVRELRQMFEALEMSDRMERYWRCTQKQRYKEHFGWLHYLEPINAQMWAIKMYHKMTKPNTYLRRKALWKSLCYGGPFLYPHYETPVITPSQSEQADVNQPTFNQPLSVGAEDIQVETPDPSSMSDILPSNDENENIQNTEEAFAEWVKNSGGNLRVTIDYAWSELQDGGDLKTDVVEPYRMELVTSLNELEHAIQTFGLDGKHIGNDDAAVYAGVLLRFTQALHDYLEMKDKAMENIRQEEGRKNEEWVSSMNINVDDETGEIETDRNVKLAEQKDLTESSMDVSSETRLHDKAVSDYEKTKRLLQYLDEVVGSSPGISVAASINLHGETSPLSIAGPGIVLSAGTVTKDHKEVAPTEIHEASGPLLSARRRFYQQRASDTLLHSTNSRSLNQTDSMFSTVDELHELRFRFNDNFNGDSEKDNSVLDKSLTENHTAEDDGKKFVLHLTQGEALKIFERSLNSALTPDPINMNINEY